jgi:hypothetical protein
MKFTERRGRKSTKTIGKIRELDVKVNSKYLSYVEKHNYVIVREQKQSIYTTIKASDFDGDLRATFYAAAGVRNVILKKGHKPDSKQRMRIYQRAMHTHATRDIWMKAKKESKNPFRKEVELTPESDQHISIPASRLGSLGDIKATDKNIEDKSEVKMTKKKTGKKNVSAATKLKELGLDMDPTGLTYKKLKKSTTVTVRIPKKGKENISANINSKLVDGDDVLLFKVAKDVYEFMVAEGRKATKEKIVAIVKMYSEKQGGATKKQNAKKKQDAKTKTKVEPKVEPKVIESEPETLEDITDLPPEPKKSFWQKIKSVFS